LAELIIQGMLFHCDVHHNSDHGINFAQGESQTFTLDSLASHVHGLAPDGLFTATSELKANGVTLVMDPGRAPQQLLHMNEASKDMHCSVSKFKAHPSLSLLPYVWCD
jgi:hypothetical protein